MNLQQPAKILTALLIATVVFGLGVGLFVTAMIWQLMIDWQRLDQTDSPYLTLGASAFAVALPFVMKF